MVYAGESWYARSLNLLEFDRVVLVDPAGIIVRSANGGHDLYVAITRATRRLTVVYQGKLPAVLGMVVES